MGKQENLRRTVLIYNMKLLVLNHQLLGGRGQLTEPESVGSNVNRTPDHASSSEFFFSSNPYESIVKKIRDNKTVLSSGDVSLTTSRLLRCGVLVGSGCNINRNSAPWSK
jgi:hypothetical protein